jgi:hypothetical protein
MVGAANSDSARISFFGSTKGELAQKLDRGKDAAGCRRLIQVPPEPREMVAYYTAHKLCLGWGYLLFVGGTAHAGSRFAASYAFPLKGIPSPFSDEWEEKVKGHIMVPIGNLTLLFHFDWLL